MYEEKRRLKILSKRFALNKNVDISFGRCCGKYDNEKGAKCVKAMDLIFIPNLPRFIFALWATCDGDKFPLYARMRLLSCYVFWAISIFMVIGSASYEVSVNDEIEAMVIINSILILSGLLVCAIVDYHYSRVVIFYANGHAKRQER